MYLLENKTIAVYLNESGQLTMIKNKLLNDSYCIIKDEINIKYDLNILSVGTIIVGLVNCNKNQIVFSFNNNDYFDLDLIYQINGDNRFFERYIQIKTKSNIVIQEIEFKTAFEILPEVIDYKTFWYAPTVAFIRWNNGGIFAGIENPFFTVSSQENEVSFSFEPSLIMGEKELYESEPQFIGAYKFFEKKIINKPPKTLDGLKENYTRARFRNPCGHIPLDIGEISAMREFASYYLSISINSYKFRTILYGYWYPIRQMPDESGIDCEKSFYNMIDQFGEIDGDIIVYNALTPYNIPDKPNGGYWRVSAEGKASERILRYTRDKGIKYGFYMGVACRGDSGNASALPFMPEKTLWKKTGRGGKIGRENCLACDEYAEWWLDVQCNTIERYGLSYWSWDPGPGNGNHCFSDEHGHLPGKGAYKGWRNSMSLLKKMKQRCPDVYLMSFYGRKEYGLWGLKYFDQHESYWEQTILYGGTVHPDIHDDRVNADGVRLQNWWNTNFRFLPSVIGHALAHRIGEHSYDPRLTKAWDYGGWKYALMSALACCGGSVTLCIMPEDISLVSGMAEFYRKWTGWAKENIHYAHYNIPFGSQVEIGGIDGYARIKDGNGYIFLCNPAPRPAKISFVLNEEIGFDSPNKILLKQIYPGECYYYDNLLNSGVFSKKDCLTVIVPAFEIILFELQPFIETVIPDISEDFIPPESIPVPVSIPIVRELNYWKYSDDKPFIFPSHKAYSKLEISTTFFADAQIKEILEKSKPENSVEIEALIPEWTNKEKIELPHNFKWATPYRILFVMPLINANMINNAVIKFNGEITELDCFILQGVKIIYYSDITEIIKFDQYNEVTLILDGIGENQFLGPYLDYPAEEKTADLLCSKTNTQNKLIYDKIIPEKLLIPKEPYSSQFELRIKYAEMIPDTVPYEGGTITVRAKTDTDAEYLNGIYFANGAMPHEVKLQYNNIDDLWECEIFISRRTTNIIDSPYGYLWIVDKNGNIGDTFAFEMNRQLSEN